MKRIWLLSIVLLAVAAMEFGALGAASAGASFVPAWLASSNEKPAALRGGNRTPTPVSPPSQPPCQPDREHGQSAACDREPASIQLTPDPLVIECNGYDRSTLTVRITDAKGHAVTDGTLVSFWAYNGIAMPAQAQTKNGVASTSVAFYGDIFPSGPNLNVDAGPLEAGVRIRCFPVSNPTPPSPPPCSPSPPPLSPPCATPTPPSPPPCSPSPPSLSPPCATPTPSPAPCSPSPPSPSPPCVTPTPPPTPVVTPCPTSPAGFGSVCGDPIFGSATIAVSASQSPQAVGVPFGVAIDLTSFTSGQSTVWAGYDLELAYDTSVVQAISDAQGLCSSWWANVTLLPRIVSGCAFQTNTTTGTLETISFVCLKDGTSPLRLVADDAPDRQFSGTHLFDTSAQPFATTLASASVTCGGPAPTQTPSPTATPTAVSGNTFAVDADGTTPGIQSVRYMAVGGGFTISSVLTAAPNPYQAFQSNISYNHAVLALTSSTQHVLGAATICAGPQAGDPTLFEGCARISGTQSDIGDTIDYGLTCIASGTSALHLLTGAEVGEALSTSFALANGNVVGAATIDATVICLGAGTPTPIPTATPSAIPFG